MPQRVLGIIGARGGSKGIPGKNIKWLAGKPLIAYAIEAADAAKRLTRCIVSTDDPEIIAVAREFGADVPFQRPNELATDTALQIDALMHAVRMVGEQGETPYDDVIVIHDNLGYGHCKLVVIVPESWIDVETMEDLAIHHDAQQLVPQLLGHPRGHLIAHGARAQYLEDLAGLHLCERPHGLQRGQRAAETRHVQSRVDQDALE